MFTDATITDINNALLDSWNAFEQYRQLNLKQRAQFLRAIGDEMNAIKASLLDIANKETHLDKSRLEVEFNRTVFQLNNYAKACEDGAWLDIRIDTGNSDRTPAKADLRKMLLPLGPVVVFGASNFPFAYSTAGGDTACALAAGCPVIIKAHPAHAGTSEKVAEAVKAAASKCKLPGNIFIHLHGTSFEVGKALVEHPLTKAVGFTGSFEGGKALFDIAARRKVPIPVFAEMGSVNPVFFLPEKLKADANLIASMFASSITQSAGQFCTNPGILVGIKGPELEQFLEVLANKIEQVHPAEMLHPGIAKSFHIKRKEALMQENVTIVAETAFKSTETESIPTVARTTAQSFLQNPLLHKEVFGPYSLMVICSSVQEMTEVAKNFEGQLTATLIATNDEIKNNGTLVNALTQICGRFIINGVPTGVEVALAMHHGGPYPSTTDSRFTSVGADGIKRFARPVCYQGWPNDLLPEELKNENPLGIWRTVNNELTNKAIV